MCVDRTGRAQSARAALLRVIAAALVDVTKCTSRLVHGVWRSLFGGRHGSPWWWSIVGGGVCVTWDARIMCCGWSSSCLSFCCAGRSARLFLASSGLQPLVLPRRSRSQLGSLVLFDVVRAGGCFVGALLPRLDVVDSARRLRTFVAAVTRRLSASLGFARTSGAAVELVWSCGVVASSARRLFSLCCWTRVALFDAFCRPTGPQSRRRCSPITVGSRARWAGRDRAQSPLCY